MTLPFAMIRQAPHDFWCFAAVTASLWRFYAQSDQLQMCEVVSRVRGEPCCPPTPNCELPADLEQALQLFSLFERQVPSSIPFGAGVQPCITDEIDAGRPVCLALHFGTYIHFCVVHGYQQGSRLLAIADSLFDDQLVDYSALLA